MKSKEIWRTRFRRAPDTRTPFLYSWDVLPSGQVDELLSKKPLEKSLGDFYADFFV